MTIATFPSGIAMGNVKITVEQPTRVTDAISYEQTRQNTPYHRRTISFTVTCDRNDNRRLRGFVESLNGRFTPFYLKIPGENEVQESLGGTPTVVAPVTRLDNTLQYKGVLGNFNIGDFISFGVQPKLYTVTKANHTTNIITVMPPLRFDLTADMVIHYSTKFKVVLAKDATTSSSRDGFAYNWTFNVIETN